MRRAVVLAFCMTLLLAGCGGRTAEPTPTPGPVPSSTPRPTPSPTPRPDPEQGLYLDVGDGEHRFWVEAASTGEWVNDFARELTLSVYREKEDEEPVQVIETETGMWPSGFQLYGEDVDFDGNTDFYYTYSQGTHDSYYSFYIWDPAAERFIPDPYGLDALPSPGFHGESKTVAAGHRSAASGSTIYYRYQDGALDPIRECWFDAWGGICRMAVQDKQYGSMQTVFQVERDGAFTDEDWEAFSDWYNLDYRGE